MARSPRCGAQRPAFASWVTADGYVPGWLLIMVGFMVFAVGLVAFYLAIRPESPGRVDALLVFLYVGLLAYFPFPGAFAFSWPLVGEMILAGDIDAVAAVKEMWLNPAAVVLGLASAIGYVLSSAGLAWYARRRFPRWALLLFVLQAPLISSDDFFMYPVGLVGAVMLTVAGIAFALVPRGNAPAAQPNSSALATSGPSSTSVPSGATSSQE